MRLAFNPLDGYAPDGAAFTLGSANGLPACKPMAHRREGCRAQPTGVDGAAAAKRLQGGQNRSGSPSNHPLQTARASGKSVAPGHI